MVENRVIDANLVARLGAQFFSYFLNTVILRAQFIACFADTVVLARTVFTIYFCKKAGHVWGTPPGSFINVILQLLASGTGPRQVHYRSAIDS